MSILRNDKESIKQGLTRRINAVNAKMVMAEAQGDFLEALKYNSMKVELLFLQMEVIFSQIRGMLIG